MIVAVSVILKASGIFFSPVRIQEHTSAHVHRSFSSYSGLCVCVVCAY